MNDQWALFIMESLSDGVFQQNRVLYWWNILSRVLIKLVFNKNIGQLKRVCPSVYVSASLF